MTEKKKEKEVVCYYGCGKPMLGEYFAVIKAGVLVRAHSKCHRLSQTGKQTIKFKVK